MEVVKAKGCEYQKPDRDEEEDEDGVKPERRGGMCMKKRETTLEADDVGDGEACADGD
jgi:hypothetical protein